MKRNFWSILDFMVPVILILLLGFAGACSGDGSAADDVLGADEDPLDGSEWLLTAYRKSSPGAGVTITARFDGGQVSGSGGCNNYTGSYQVDGERINVSGIAITEKACITPEGVMGDEQVFIDMLRGADRFVLEGDQLSIYQGREALTFVRQ